MNYKILLISTLLLACQSHAVCINNITQHDLYFEIENKNIGANSPIVKFHQGQLQAGQKKCFAHGTSDKDWKIFRYDLISVFHLLPKEPRKQVCSKMVMGILNTLTVDYNDFSDTWWCLDRSDDQD